MSRVILVNYINSNLPKNVCVQVYDGYDELLTFFEKLGDMWTGVVAPDTAEDGKVKWTMPYLEYTLNNEKCYLIWFFVNDKDMEEKDILKEIKEFLGEVKEG